MIPVLNADQMRAADRRTIETIGLPGAVLMENAGAAVAALVRRRFPGKRRLAILCGKGNNGGDGFVAARRLLELGPSVVLLGLRAELQGDAALHALAYERSGGRTQEIASDSERDALEAVLARADLILDALLGTGLDRPPAGRMAHAIEGIRRARAERGCAVVAIDLPSGLSSDGGACEWPVVEADVTVAFAAPKWGHVLPPGCDAVGELVIAEIGIPRSVLLETGAELGLLEATDAALAFPRRLSAAHKGDFGRVLVIAGSIGKTGAAVLAGTAALRAGAGLVTVATPSAVLPLVASARAELMTEPLPDDLGFVNPRAVAPALRLAEACDSVVLGPGLGQGSGVREFVLEFLARCPCPLVLDADGLNAVAAAATAGSPLATARPAATVLTPHPGEMGRLLGIPSSEVQNGRVHAVRRLASAAQAVVVLKGHRSLVADAAGRTAVNPTGNPGLATAGSGDVLAGVVGALLARTGDAWLAATAGVFVHGRAADLVAREQGEAALIAGDVVLALGRAVISLSQADGAGSPACV